MVAVGTGAFLDWLGSAGGGGPYSSSGMEKAGRGFTLSETMLAIAVVCVLLAMLFPALEAGRAASRRQVCSGNLRVLGQAWQSCLSAEGDRFPVVPTQPGWRYG